MKNDKYTEEFKKLKEWMEAMPELNDVVKSIDTASKDVKLAKEIQRIDLPYVSAEPIHGSEWNK